MDGDRREDGFDKGSSTSTCHETNFPGREPFGHRIDQRLQVCSLEFVYRQRDGKILAGELSELAQKQLLDQVNVALRAPYQSDMALCLCWCADQTHLQKPPTQHEPTQCLEQMV
jgi:hypothetical protein